MENFNAFSASNAPLWSLYVQSHLSFPRFRTRLCLNMNRKFRGQDQGIVFAKRGWRLSEQVAHETEISPSGWLCSTNVTKKRAHCWALLEGRERWNGHYWVRRQHCWFTRPGDFLWSLSLSRWLVRSGFGVWVRKRTNLLKLRARSTSKIPLITIFRVGAQSVTDVSFDDCREVPAIANAGQRVRQRRFFKHELGI